MATPDFLQDYAKDFATQAKAAYSVPIDTAKFTGRQFVAGEDPLQTQAIGIAQQGVGAYKPFLSAAQAAQADAATTIGGLGAISTAAQGLTGPQAYQPFMSPYQQQVIDTTLAEFDKQGFAGEQAIKDAAVMSGNFGGGREGAQLGQFQADRLADRAALQAQLLQSGFGQAQSAAQQAFANQQALLQQQLGIAGAQSGLGTAQMGLSNFQRAGLGADVGALGQLGSLRQGLSQAQLQADADAARTMAYEPYGRLSAYGSGLTGLSGGVQAQQFAQPQPVSPLSQAIGTALGVGGLYGKIFGFPGDK
tara:strand:- start:180 stop:1097 length:918 start_codon:yes stop_codon:yes gene_type:complete